MRLLAWTLLLLSLLLIVSACWCQKANEPWLVVLLASLAGGMLSILSSLVVNRMTVVHQQVAEILARVKAANPLSPGLGHEIRIRRELLTDMGMKEHARVIVELNKVIDACERNAEHGEGADPLYRVLKKAVLCSTVQSIFWPHFGH